jgi:membrane-bound serine protease (ClpP class)
VRLPAIEEKMQSLINPNVAYLLIVAAVMLFMLSINDPKSALPKVGMALCLVAAGYELVHLKGNPWAFLVVALSPLPFFVALHQTRLNLPVLIATILMLTMGSVFLFVDQNGRPVVNYLLAGGVSLACAEVIWITLRRTKASEGASSSDLSASVVGLIGEVFTDIEVHSTGSVKVEGELWQARSEKPIAAGNMVRVLRQDGPTLTVRKAEVWGKK